MQLEVNQRFLLKERDIIKIIKIENNDIAYTIEGDHNKYWSTKQSFRVSLKKGILEYIPPRLIWNSTKNI